MARLLCLLFCVMAWGQQPARVEGRVVNDVSNEPVRKATLRLSHVTDRSAAPLAATSNDSGDFVFEGVEPGTYYLMAERAGYLRQRYGAKAGTNAMGTPIQLAADQRLKNLAIKLVPQGVITGKVVDEEGDPIPRAMVSLTQQSKFGAQGPRSTQTGVNEIGEFRFADLPPGRYIVSVGAIFGSPPPATPPADKPEEGYVPTFYPGVTDAMAAAPIEVGPGQQINGIEIRPKKSTVYRIRGKLVPAGPQIFVTLIPRDRRRSGSFSGPGAQPKPDGTFELTRVPPGSYYVLAMRQDGRSQANLGRVPVDVHNAHVEGLTVPLAEPVVVTAFMRFEDPQPEIKPRGYITLYPLDNFGFNSPGGGVSEGGSLKFEPVAREKFQFLLNGLPDGYYVRSIRRGSEEILDKGLDLTSAESPVELEFILSGKSAAVEGVVKDDSKLVPGAAVALFADSEAVQYHLHHRADADKDGRFTIRGVAPGAYRVYAWEEAPSPGLIDPALVKAYRGKSTKISLRENSRERVELKTLKPEDADSR